MNAIQMGWKHGGALQVNVAQINHGQILQDKNILVTGGTSGIGFEIARKSLSEGANVLITGRCPDRLKEAALELSHPNLKTMTWDVSDIKSSSSKLAQAHEILEGQITILVNNAGLISTTPFHDVSEEIWDSIYETNSKGLFFMSQLFSKDWIQKNMRGKIINISSSGGFLSAENPYRMTKWDVVGLTRGLGGSLYKHGIIVNGIAPGMTSTKMLGSEESDNKFIERYTPSQRVALPEEVAELAIFIMSDAANYIVGHTIICDGGYSLKS